ncbi:MAG: metallophosphoesterase [Candidatus Eremiobacteraeota bacterium]|nr:metallophosphoesterase [Candidatus Eremiobacteraeota bacterium]
MKRRRARASLFVAAILIGLLSAGCGGAGTDQALYRQGGDSSFFSFAVIGDNQVGYQVWQQTMLTNPSSANIPQLRQSLADISSLSAIPSMLFFSGDLVMNEAMDSGETLTGQLDAWQSFYRSQELSRLIPLVPLTGNHEVVFYDGTLNAEAPNPPAFQAWTAWLQKNNYATYGGNGPLPQGANPDLLVLDESLLTYSFDRGVLHFVIINSDTMNTTTDPETGLTTLGWIPITWIEDDIRKAQAKSSTMAILVLSHKTIEPPPDYPYAYSDIINTPDYPFGARLSRVMKENSKVRLFLASHYHMWSAHKLDGGLGVWQVMTGNGGAPLENSWNPQGGTYYGFTAVEVYESGKLIVKNYGRPLPPAPQKFYEATPVAPPPATLRETIEIPPAW